MKKRFLGKVDVRRKIGSYAKLERLLDKKGLLEDIITTTNKGFGGGVWSIKRNGREYIGISTYSRKVRRKRDGKVFYIYKYYLVRPERIDELLSLFYDD
jgi:hypothetical protein